MPTSLTFISETVLKGCTGIAKPETTRLASKAAVKDSETKLLMATIYDVLIAVTLGFLSLVAAVFQVWVAWQQWQHPVQQGSTPAP
jgi:hypothetical protein